jgi:hypothetical protein
MTDLLIRPASTGEAGRALVGLCQRVETVAAMLTASENPDLERTEFDSEAFFALGLLIGSAIERDGDLSPTSLRAAILADREWLPYPGDRPAVASEALDRLAFAADVVLSEALLEAVERGEPW